MTTQTLSLKQKLFHEAQAVALATLYFLIWFGILMFLKTMILSEYKVQFSGVSKAVVGALILAKVVLVIDRIPLSPWTRKHSAIYFIIFRTLLSNFGVFVVLVLEHAFKARHEYGGFKGALINVFQHSDMYHVWVVITVVSISVFWFNVLFVLRKYLGEHELSQLFFLTPMTSLLAKRGEGNHL